jgi:branched-chain amino acid transport system permease protein
MMPEVAVLLTTAKRVWPLAALLILVLAGALIADQGSPEIQQALALGLINLIVVVGIYSYVGLTGIFSFGHIAFMAVGAYAAGLMTIPAIQKGALLTGLPTFIAEAHTSVFVSLLIGGAVAAILAFLLSFSLTRMVGLAAAISTLALLLIVYTVGQNWEGVTGGTTGMTGVPIRTTVGSLTIWATLAIILVYLFQQSSIGLRLRATRDDELAALGAGISLRRCRTYALVLSAFVVGFGGGLYGEYMGSFTPDAFYLTQTFLTIVMLVVGGIRSLSGAVIGSIFVTVTSQLLTRIENGTHVGPIWVPSRHGVAAVGLALILLGILIWRPEGITRGREIFWPLGRARPPRPSGGSD